MISFSILVCSYNPDPKTILCLLKAISAFDPSSPLHEVIIIDNNSEIPLCSMDFVINFIESGDNRKLIVEKEPGLTNARIAGIKASKYDWIIFFDDDNEPFSNYLIEAEKAVMTFPQVGVWGPGRISVDYIDIKVSNWFNNHKYLFQDKYEKETIFKNQETWQSCYPNGTGFIVKKIVLEEYTKLVYSKELTLSDRTGNSLQSGGDTQIVLCAIKLGFYAGTYQTLELRHLIDSKKSNISYLLRHSYMTASCYLKAFLEIGFTSTKIEIELNKNIDILFMLYNICRVHLFKKSFYDFMLILYTRLGEVNSRYVVKKINRKPFILIFFEKLINV